MLENHYPRIVQVIPVKNMYQEHCGQDSEVYIKVFAWVLLEDIVNGKVKQYSRYMSYSDLGYIEYDLPKISEEEATWIADVHFDDISQGAKLDYNLKAD